MSKKQNLTNSINKYKKAKEAMDKAVASLEALIGADAIYDSVLGQALAELLESNTDTIETVYGLPWEDVEWLCSLKEEKLYTLPCGKQVIVGSVEDYVEKVYES